MASSSVSQESLDREEYEYNTRRNRIRAFRNRSSSQRGESFDKGGDNVNGESGAGEGDKPYPNTPGIGAAGGEHESPTRGSAGRLKDKRGRPNHFPKGKTAKDKRKLREKRRSTGVVHMPSTESTGDSLDDEDDYRTGETKRNTSYNEVIDADNPQTPEEEDKVPVSYTPRSMRNKSPSDLEADLEDNQDYDSTVSQSETNLTMVGKCSPQTAAVGKFHRNQTSPDSPRPVHALSHRDEQSSRPVSYPSRFRDQDQEIESGYLPGGRGGLISSRFKEHHHHHHHHHRDNTDGLHRPLHHKQELRTSRIENQESTLIARIKELEKNLEQEREANRRLQNVVEEKDLMIAQLENEIKLLHQDLETVDEENEKLQQENRVLLRAMARLRIQ